MVKQGPGGCGDWPVRRIYPCVFVFFRVYTRFFLLIYPITFVRAQALGGQRAQRRDPELYTKYVQFDISDLHDTALYRFHGCTQSAHLWIRPVQFQADGKQNYKLKKGQSQVRISWNAEIHDESTSQSNPTKIFDRRKQGLYGTGLAEISRFCVGNSMHSPEQHFDSR